ncbi:hypothetical protein C0Q70_04254 [Pomacea canaliculata]|uniref:PID domain-containing protein n=1 Tax=Pomacea canaliculata TaxID=400727 RepID=A0A2T7PV52_POMCA|nr:uncharacterized protein LOC112557744 [Pomacea canaliculata]PVD37257.1 hypothetical protein C0Q70_04254 [Pomacea canaliculata]
MAEPDTVSNDSSSVTVELSSDGDTELELLAATSRFDAALTLAPDADIGGRDTDSVGAASTSSSSLADHPRLSDDSDNDDNDGGSSTTSKSSDKRDPSDKDSRAADKAKDKGSGKGSKSKGKESKDGKGGKNPFSLLRRLTKADKSQKKERSFSDFDQVRIDRLPQVFVAKYLGSREVHGFCGLHHVRRPVDEMVARVQKSLEAKEHVELPLVYVIVSPKGLDIREHKQNRQKQGLSAGLIPIDFISYGVQDIKFWRVFTFIVVREMSFRAKATECHAYLCDTSLNARKMALSLGASFKVYSKSLKTEGKSHNFQVELRPPDELAESYSKEVEA